MLIYILENRSLFNIVFIIQWFFHCFRIQHTFIRYNVDLLEILWCEICPSFRLNISGFLSTCTESNDPPPHRLFFTTPLTTLYIYARKHIKRSWKSYSRPFLPQGLTYNFCFSLNSRVAQTTYNCTYLIYLTR